MAQLSIQARLYVGVVVGLGAGAAAPAVWPSRGAWLPQDRSLLLATLVLYVLLESVSTIRVGVATSLSVGFPVALAGVILLPPSGAALVASGVAFAHAPGGLPLVKRAFNGAMFSVSAFVAGLAYHEILPGPHAPVVGAFPGILVPTFGAAAAYSLVNGFLLAGVIVVAAEAPFGTVWRETVRSSMVPYLGYGLFGLMMAALYEGQPGPFAALLVLLPLLVARWAFAQYAAQRSAYEATVRSLVQAVETKDFYTRGHSERVAAGAEMIARAIEMREERVNSLRYAGLLHDVGKLGVPTRLLQKSAALAPGELVAIQQHPVRGVEMVRGITFLDEAYDGIMHHHERLDGSGYPMGLRGDEIPEFARIIAVADAFDSMTSTRSYRAARPVAAALAELARCAGSYFDPAFVAAFVGAVGAHGWGYAHLEPPAESEATSVAHYDHDDLVMPVRVAPDTSP